MATKLKFGNVLLCEHAVEGARNKHTLVNVFSGDVLVSQMPATLFFGLYMEFFADKSGAVELDMELRLGGKRIAEVKVGAEHVEKGGAVTFVIPGFQIIIERDTVFEVIASAPSYQKTRILSKKISSGDVVP